MKYDINNGFSIKNGTIKGTLYSYYNSQLINLNYEL